MNRKLNDITRIKHDKPNSTKDIIYKFSHFNKSLISTNKIKAYFSKYLNKHLSNCVKLVNVFAAFSWPRKIIQIENLSNEIGKNRILLGSKKICNIFFKVII